MQHLNEYQNKTIIFFNLKHSQILPKGILWDNKFN